MVYVTDVAAPETKWNKPGQKLYQEGAAYSSGSAAPRPAPRAPLLQAAAVTGHAELPALEKAARLHALRVPVTRREAGFSYTRICNIRKRTLETEWPVFPKKGP